MRRGCEAPFSDAVTGIGVGRPFGLTELPQRLSERPRTSELRLCDYCTTTDGMLWMNRSVQSETAGERLYTAVSGDVDLQLDSSVIRVVALSTCSQAINGKF